MEKKVTVCETTGKVRYANKSDASKAKVGFLSHKGGKTRSLRGEMTAYKCEDCGDWHIGNKGAGRQ